MRRALLGAMIVVLAVASAARADDASVQRAWEADSAVLKKLERKLNRAVNTFVATDGRRSGPMLRVLVRAKKQIGRNTRRVRREEPSTDIGARAKRTVLRANGVLGRGFSLLRKAVHNLRRGQPRLALRQARAGERRARRATRMLKTAERLFRRAKTDGVPLAPAGGPAPAAR